MKRIQKASAPFIISALWVVMLMVIGGVLADSAHGATKAEIVYEAKNKYTSAAYSMSQIVNEAFDSAEASGIAPADVSAALSQILMETSGELGRSASANINSIISSMHQALQRVTEDEAELSESFSQSLSESFSQSIQGIRAAASRMGLDLNAVRSSIESSIRNLPLTEQQKQELIGVVALAYQQTHAANYIPSPLLVAPAPPTGPPSEIADAYDPTASSTR
jgi:hypothetical protein